VTIVAIAHRLSTVRDADRILVLNHGRIAELGTHEALMAIEGGIYQRLYELQQLEDLDRLRAFAGRHGRWLTLTPDDVDRAQAWFRRHGAVSVAFGRLVPAVRSVISMPAGVAALPLATFLLWSLLGSTAWNVLLLAVGFVLESRYEAAKDVIEWVTRGVVGVLLAGYAWRVVRFDPGRP
jgi:hypothetical protein